MSTVHFTARQSRLSRRLVLGGVAAAAAAWPFRRALASFEKKHALLIGNVRYRAGVGALKNTVNDAKLLAEALKRQSFPADIINPMEDVPSKQAFLAAIDAYVQKLRAAGPEALGFFYYAGHGVANQLDQRNYLIPVDVHDAQSPALWSSSVETGELFSKLRQHTGPQIVLLDCCRRSLALPVPPTPPSEQPVQPHETPAPVTRISGRGLVRVRAQQPQNMYICYSAWEGEAASDGLANDANGPFAKALDEMLRTLEARTTHDIFKQTQLTVRRWTEGQQLPMLVDQLDETESKAPFFGAWKAQAPRPSTARNDFALIVANRHVGTRLARPRAKADGELVFRALQNCGFDCDFALDLDRPAFFARLAEFAAKLKAGGSDATGIVYYTGYGAGVHKGFENNVEIRENYLLPNGMAPMLSSELSDASCIAMTKVVDALADTGARAIAIIKDVNRQISDDITPKGNFQWGGLRERLEGQHRNIVIVHSADTKQVSLDDANGSIFAQALGPALLSSDRRSFQEVMNGVQRDVFDKTHRKQTPLVDSANLLPIFFADETGLGRERGPDPR